MTHELRSWLSTFSSSGALILVSEAVLNLLKIFQPALGELSSQLFEPQV